MALSNVEVFFYAVIPAGVAFGVATSNFRFGICLQVLVLTMVVIMTMEEE